MAKLLRPGTDIGVRRASPSSSIGRPCSISRAVLSDTKCQAQRGSSSPSVLRSASRGRHPRRSSDSSPRQERKLEDVLRTCTHQRVNEHLLVLLDPKRERLIYVLGVASVAALEKQVPGISEAAGTDLPCVFLDESTRKRLAVPQGLLTVFDVNSDGSLDESLDSNFKNFIGCFFEHWDVLVPPAAASQQSASSSQPGLLSQARGIRLPCHARLRPLPSSGRRRGMTFQQWQRFSLGKRERRRVTLRWQSLLAEYDRMAHAFPLAPGTMAVMNSDLHTLSMQPHLQPEDPTLTLLVQLGDGPRDWTLQVELRPGGRRARRGRGNHKNIERILREESLYLSNMQRLEEQWSSGSSGGSSELFIDWDHNNSAAQKSAAGLGKEQEGTPAVPLVAWLEVAGGDATSEPGAAVEASGADARVAATRAGARAEALGALVRAQASRGNAPVPALLPRPQHKVGSASPAACSTSGSGTGAPIPAAEDEAKAERRWAADHAVARMAQLLDALQQQNAAAAAAVAAAAVAAAEQEPLSVALTSQGPEDEPSVPPPPPKRPDPKRPSYLPRSFPLNSSPHTASPPPPPPSAIPKPTATLEQPSAKEDSNSSSSSRSATGPLSSRPGAIGRGAAGPRPHLLGGGAPKDTVQISLPPSMRSSSSSSTEDEGEEQQAMQGLGEAFKNFCQLVGASPKNANIQIIVPGHPSVEEHHKIRQMVEAALMSAGLADTRRISLQEEGGLGGPARQMPRQHGRTARRLELPGTVLAMAPKVKKGLKGARMSATSSAPAAAGPGEDSASAAAAAESHPSIVAALAQLRAPARRSAAFRRDVLVVAEPWALSPLAAGWHARELRVMHPSLSAGAGQA